MLFPYWFMVKTKFCYIPCMTQIVVVFHYTAVYPSKVNSSKLQNNSQENVG